MPKTLLEIHLGSLLQMAAFCRGKIRQNDHARDYFAGALWVYRSEIRWTIREIRWQREAISDGRDCGSFRDADLNPDGAEWRGLMWEGSL